MISYKNIEELLDIIRLMAKRQSETDKILSEYMKSNEIQIKATSNLLKLQEELIDKRFKNIEDYLSRNNK